MNFYKIKSARLNFNFKRSSVFCYTVVLKIFKSKNSMTKICSIGCKIHLFLVKVINSAIPLVPQRIGLSHKAFRIISQNIPSLFYPIVNCCTSGFIPSLTKYYITLLQSIRLSDKSFFPSVKNNSTMISISTNLVNHFSGSGSIPSIACKKLCILMRSYNLSVFLNYRVVSYQSLLLTTGLVCRASTFCLCRS